MAGQVSLYIGERRGYRAAEGSSVVWGTIKRKPVASLAEAHRKLVRAVETGGLNSGLIHFLNDLRHLGFANIPHKVSDAAAPSDGFVPPRAEVSEEDMARAARTLLHRLQPQSRPEGTPSAEVIAMYFEDLASCEKAHV